MKKLASIMLTGVTIYVLAMYPLMGSNSDSSKSVIVDGKSNCLLLDNAVKMEGGPGHSLFFAFHGVLPTIGMNMPIDGAYSYSLSQRK
ncbi:MAG: hypothetical protein KAT34_08555 [Candidatus Aminicenantes bacterium]|nr:hypothetical protein [Candidatus Aminicenantes bacterium]